MTLGRDQLAALAAVVREGSFEAAARALHVTPSAVSQRVRALETRVGQVLVRRAKPCAVTDAGRPLLRLAGQFDLLEREALAAAGGAPAGRVAVTLDPDSLATWFLPAVAALTGDSAVLLDLREDDQDHTAEWLRDGTVMAAVTGTAAAVQGCRVRRLGAMRYRALAAPGFAERWFADGATPGAFAVAPMIVMTRKDRLQHRFIHQLRAALDPPVHYVPSAVAFREAIRLGIGWALMPEVLADEDVAAGHAVAVAHGRHLDVAMYWQHWRLDSPVLAALTDAVTTAARDALR
ncbi:LysR family transcriptional regulator ArgP [Luedemannella flava]|uniref:LysR family transcriptional regulator ArgP n=1 Tax=Luedemannella flava TaxID=349316 RepID=A0ABN2MDR7_9ACTN